MQPTIFRVWSPAWSHAGNHNPETGGGSKGLFSSSRRRLARVSAGSKLRVRLLKLPSRSAGEGRRLALRPSARDCARLRHRGARLCRWPVRPFRCKRALPIPLPARGSAVLCPRVPSAPLPSVPAPRSTAWGCVRAARASGVQPRAPRPFVTAAAWRVLCNVTGNYMRRRVHSLPCSAQPGPPGPPPPPPPPAVADWDAEQQQPRSV